MADHPSTVLLKTIKGIDNIHDAESTDFAYLKKALNIDITNNGGIIKRQGYALKDSGNYTTIWASENGLGCYGIKDGDLVEILNTTTGYSTTVLKAGLGRFKYSFEEVDDTIFFNSINYNGIIKNKEVKEWGIAINTQIPTLTETVGSLEEGIYQVSVTYVNSLGIESGTIRAGSITVSNNSGISVKVNNPIPSNSEIVYARVYCSTQNGNTLYYSGTTTLNSTYIISDTFNLSSPLITFNLDRPPLGSIIKYYKGRIYIASNNVLYFTEPNMYYHINFSSNYIEFPDEIKEIMPVEDGIYIGSDKLYYLSGNSPEDFKNTIKENIKIVKGSAVKFSGSFLNIDNIPIGYKWLVTSDLGIFVLTNQGLVINTTAKTFSPVRSDYASSIFLQQRGMNNYLSILKDNEKENNSVIGDLVETTIIRNGLTLP